MMRQRLLLLMTGLLLPAVVSADVLPARETADVRAGGDWSLGVFNPLRLGVKDGIELEAHPLVLLSAPHITVRVRHFSGGTGGWRLAGEYGVGVPLLSWQMVNPLGVAGDLVPSCKVADKDARQSAWCDRPGTILAPSVGLALSKGLLNRSGVERAVATLRADVAKGFALTGKAASPLAAWAPADVQFAPWVGQLRGRLRAGYDRALRDDLRVRAELGAYYTTQAADDDRSPWTASAYAGLDYGIGKASRLTVGAIYWNSDMHGIELGKGADGYGQVTRVRHHEVWPTVDFIWSN